MAAFVVMKYGRFDHIAFGFCVLRFTATASANRTFHVNSFGWSRRLIVIVTAKSL